MVSLKKQLFIVFSMLQISSFTVTSQNSQPSSKENSPREKTFFPCVDAETAAQEDPKQPMLRANVFTNQSSQLLFTQEDIDNAVAKELTERPEQFTQKNLDDAVSQALSLKEFAYTLQANHDRQARQQQIKRERVFFGATLFAISAYLFSKSDCCKNNVSKPITGKIVNPCKKLMAELFNNPKAFIPSFLKASSAQIAPANPK